MQASDVIQDWYESQLVAHAQASPQTISGLVALYGSTAAVAKAAGISAKSVQRYARYEAGERGKDVRNPAAPPTTAAARKAREGLQRARDEAFDKAVARQVKRKGLTISRFAGDMCVSSECDQGKYRLVDRKPGPGDNHIDGADLENFLDAAARGDWQEAAREWEAAFFGNDGYTGAYVVPTAHMPEITRLDMEIG